MSEKSAKFVTVPRRTRKDRNRPGQASTAQLAHRLFGEVRRLIEEARGRTAAAANAGQTLLYWQVGRRVGEEILGGQRALYGERVIAELARALEAEYGRGFAEKNLRRMVQFAEAFPHAQIVAT